MIKKLIRKVKGIMTKSREKQREHNYYSIYCAVAESAKQINEELNDLIDESIKIEAKFIKEGRLNAACEERRWRLNKIAQESSHNRFISGMRADSIA